ncbi:MAG: hypothetical protein ACFWTJ_02720 [Lachnoclostridium sp.]|jgi:ketopantoate reductase
MFELEHTRNLLYELGLNTASELLDAKLEDAMHKDATYLSFLSELLEAEIQEKNAAAKKQGLSCPDCRIERHWKSSILGFNPA